MHDGQLQEHSVWRQPVQQHLIHHIPYQECPAQQHLGQLNDVTTSYLRAAGTEQFSARPGTGVGMCSDVS